jgi:hypothetical protein
MLMAIFSTIYFWTWVRGFMLCTVCLLEVHGGLYILELPSRRAAGDGHSKAFIDRFSDGQNLKPSSSRSLKWPAHRSPPKGNIPNVATLTLQTDTAPCRELHPTALGRTCSLPHQSNAIQSHYTVDTLCLHGCPPAYLFS